MDEYKEKQTDAEERPALAGMWKKLRRYAVIGVLVLMVNLIAFSVVAWNINRKLKSELSDAEKEMQILQDLVDKEQGENETLQEKLDELLGIQDAEPVITKIGRAHV